MAAVINKRDVALQAASPRTATVNLGSTVNVSGTVSGNVTGTLDGSAVSTVVSAALSATSNYFTTSASDPSGGANGDAHFNTSTNVMWFKVSGAWTRGGTVSASEITTGTLAAARIAAGSITATKLSVSSLSAVSANLGTVTAGDITGTSNISITGTGIFQGNSTLGGADAAVHVNQALGSINGIMAYGNSGTGTSAIKGIATTTNTTGVIGQANVSGAIGMRAINSFGGGVGLAVTGAMTISSSALVSNLRSATCLLADNATKFAGYANGGSGTGSATATFISTNKPGANSSNTWWSLTNGGTTIRIPIWLT